MTPDEARSTYQTMSPEDKAEVEAMTSAGELGRDAVRKVISRRAQDAAAAPYHTEPSLGDKALSFGAGMAESASQGAVGELSGMMAAAAAPIMKASEGDYQGAARALPGMMLAGPIGARVGNWIGGSDSFDVGKGTHQDDIDRMSAGKRAGAYGGGHLLGDVGQALLGGAALPSVGKAARGGMDAMKRALGMGVDVAKDAARTGLGKVAGKGVSAKYLGEPTPVPEVAPAPPPDPHAYPSALMEGSSTMSAAPAEVPMSLGAPKNTDLLARLGRELDNTMSADVAAGRFPAKAPAMPADVMAGASPRVPTATSAPTMSLVDKPGARFNLERETARVAEIARTQGRGAAQAEIDRLAQAHGTADHQAGGVAKRLSLNLPEGAPMKRESAFPNRPGSALPASMEGAHTARQEASGAPWRDDGEIGEMIKAARAKVGIGLVEQRPPMPIDPRGSGFGAIHMPRNADKIRALMLEGKTDEEILAMNLGNLGSMRTMRLAIEQGL